MRFFIDSFEALLHRRERNASIFVFIFDNNFIPTRRIEKWQIRFVPKRTFIVRFRNEIWNEIGRNLEKVSTRRDITIGGFLIPAKLSFRAETRSFHFVVLSEDETII